MSRKISFMLPTGTSMLEEVVTIPREDSPQETETFQVMITKSRVYGNIIFTVAADSLNTNTSVTKWGADKVDPEPIILNSGVLGCQVTFRLTVDPRRYTLDVEF